MSRYAVAPSRRFTVTLVPYREHAKMASMQSPANHDIDEAQIMP